MPSTLVSLQFGHSVRRNKGVRLRRPGFSDTLIKHSLRHIDSGGYSIAECLMYSFAIVEALDVAEDRDPCRVTCIERFAMDQLVFEC